MQVRKLAEIPFPVGLEGIEGLPQTRRALHNCFNDQGRIIQRPGINLISTTSRVARGAFEWNGSLYSVQSQDLIKITNLVSGAFSVIGTIAGTADVVTATGFNHAVIVVKGGNGYTLDKSDVLTQITSPQYSASDSVAHINNRFVYVPTDGDPAFFSDAGAAGTIQTTSFFDAEELPDLNKVVINFRNILIIGGSDSLEQFRGFDDNIVPFRRLNARIDNGYIGGILEYNNTLLFIGREKGQDVGIFQTGQGSAPKISNHFIDTILSTYTETELSNAKASRIKWRGYDIATFILERDAFGWINGSWFRLSTRSLGENVTWQGGFITEFNLKYYAFDSDRFGVVAAVNKDFGDNFERLIDFGFPVDGTLYLQSLTYRLSQGYNDAVGSVTLQMSGDNVLYSPEFHHNTGELGNYVNQMHFEYPGGLGSYDRFMGLRLWTAEDIDFSASAMEMETR
jgi:hypothetical protein